MIKRFVIKPMRIILPLITVFAVAACGQKGPLQPQPMPEQNQPEQQQPDGTDN